MDSFPLLGADLVGCILGFPAYVDIYALGKPIEKRKSFFVGHVERRDA